MGTLATAYGVAWLAVATYVLWLGIQNRRLSSRLKVLESAPERTRIPQ